MAQKNRVKIPTLKTKNHMAKNAEWKWIILPCLLVLCASIILLYLWIGNRNSTNTNIDYIRSFMTSTGKLNDFSNKLSMHDPYKDIRWEWTDEGEVAILFGRIILDWESTEDFLNQDVQTKLGTIGFVTEVINDEHDKDKDGDREEILNINIYWKDILVERCVELDYFGK